MCYVTYTFDFCLFFSLLLSAQLQRGNWQCNAMDDFRMGTVFVVVIGIFFACCRVVVYILPVILI
jgi:hypothetical protein